MVVTSPDVTQLSDLARRAQPLVLAREQLLPVLPALAPLLPHAALQRGTVVGVDGAGGTTSLALALLAGASQSGMWTAAVGLPSLGPAAAAELGIDLARFALVPDPGAQWAVVTAALLDAVDAVLLRAPARPQANDVRRLVARARERGAVIVTVGRWSEAPDVRLTATAAEWHGLGDGFGHLQSRRVEVVATGRRSAARERRAWLWLPGRDGVDPASPPPGHHQRTVVAEPEPEPEIEKRAG